MVRTHWAILGLLLVLRGCNCQGPCRGEWSRCESGIAVSCFRNPHVPWTSYHWTKHDCAAEGLTCIEDSGKAACAAKADRCDPATFVPVVRDPGLPSEHAVVCTKKVGSASFTQKIEPKCTANGMEYLVTPGGSIGCVFDKTPCDPETYRESCPDDTHWVVCQRQALLLDQGSHGGDPALALSYPVRTTCGTNQHCETRSDGAVGCVADSPPAGGQVPQGSDN